MTAQKKYEIVDPQKFETTIEDDGFEYPLEHVLLHRDQAITDYFQDLENVDAEADAEIRALKAAENCYKEMYLTVNGIQMEEGSTAPDVDLIPREHKRQIIENRVLGFLVKPLPRSDTPIDLRGWRQKKKANVTRKAQVFCGDNLIEVSFTLKPVEAENYKEYLKAQGATVARRIEILQKQYERLFVTATGYESLIPLHHQILIIQSHLNKALVTEKN